VGVAVELAPIVVIREEEFVLLFLESSWVPGRVRAQA
jgi:hypothetical protein